MLWTVQPKEFYERLILNGEYFAPVNEYLTDFEKNAYDWLMSQMNNRIGLCSEKEVSPIWAWYQWIDANKNKPDLRFRCHQFPGTESVHLTIKSQ